MILDKLKVAFKKPNPHLNKTIANIGLTDRTYHVLRRAEIWTVGDLVQLSRKSLKGCRGAVRGTVVEVEKVLDGMGLKLREGEK